MALLPCSSLASCLLTRRLAIPLERSFPTEVSSLSCLSCCSCFLPQDETICFSSC